MQTGKPAIRVGGDGFEPVADADAGDLGDVGTDSGGDSGADAGDGLYEDGGPEDDGQPEDGDTQGDDGPGPDSEMLLFDGDKEHGFYRVVGKRIFLVFGDGSGGVATVHMRQNNGRITEAKYQGTLYTTACASKSLPVPGIQATSSRNRVADRLCSSTRLAVLRPRF